MADQVLYGVVELERNLRGIADAQPHKIKWALKSEFRIELNEAIRRCPKKTGALRDSAKLEEPVVNDDEISIFLTFGDESVEYAVPVHEDLEAIHPIGQAKFLESTILESAPYMGRRLANRIELYK